MPSTISENGIVGQATSFNLTLSGGSSYTYTQTFGNICNVSINENIATVTITPVTSGTLTGSITFNEEATCNITINVSEPTPTEGLQPTTVSYTMRAEESSVTFDFTLLDYDSDTEEVNYNFESSIEDTVLSINEETLYNPDRYRLTMDSSNQSEQAVVGNVYVKAKIYDLESRELLREYIATINLTIQGFEP